MQYILIKKLQRFLNESGIVFAIGNVRNCSNQLGEEYFCEGGCHATVVVKDRSQGQGIITKQALSPLS